MVKLIGYIFLIFVLCNSCKKETAVEGPPGAAGSQGMDGRLLDTGTLSGRLSLYNEFSWPVADSSGVTVQLKAGNNTRTATTDASGNYFFHELAAGTYNLTYEKTGFGTMKVFGVAHSPGSSLPTIIPEIYMLQTPLRTAIDSITITATSFFYIFLRIHVDTSSLNYIQYPGNFVLLIGKNPGLNTTNTPLSDLSQYILPDGYGAYTLVIDRSLLGGAGNTTDTYYITLGTYNRWIHKLKNPDYFFDTSGFSDYPNPENGSVVYPNLKLSPNTIKIN